MQHLPRDSHDERLLSHARPADWVNPTPSGKYQLVAIGGGTAGIVASLGAAALGAKVALVEAKLLGGDCLNFGCVPSKALVRSARAAHDLAEAPAFGFHGAVQGYFDFPAVIDRVRRLRADISPHDSAERLAAAGVDVYFGSAKFTGPRQIDVAGQTLHFSRAMIATGTHPAEPPVEGLAELGYLTNETVFALDELPRRLIVIGAGPVGCELAQAFRRLGSEVHLVNDQERLLVKEDVEVRELIAARFAAEGINLHLGWQGIKAQRLGTAKALLIGRARERRQLIGDELLVAVGRRPNVEALDLAAAGIDANQRGIVVNDYLQTTNRRVFAAGDVCTAMRHTQTAFAMARIVVQNALFWRHKRFSRLVIPRTTFTDPEVAHVGLTQAEAERRGVAIDTFRVEMKDVDRAVVDGQSSGFAAIHVRKGTGTIVGGTIAGAHAGELIGQLTLLMSHRLPLSALACTVPCYPTLAEVLHRAAVEYERGRLTPRVRRLLARFSAWRG